MADKKPAAGNKPGTDKKTNAGATKPPAGNGSAASDEATRKRNFLSPQKALAIQIAGLVAILNLEAVAAVLTDEQKEQVKTAGTMADELNSQTIKPVQDRIKVIQAELKELTADPAKLAEPDVVTKVRDHANELARLNKRMETFTGAAAATV